MRTSGKTSSPIEGRDDPAGVVVALAGRLVDRPNATRSRFPPESVPMIRAQLAEIFADLNVRDLVSSAAAGADLLALEAAEARGVRRHVILPGDPSDFLDHSVSSRPGPWPALFNRLVLTPAPLLKLETLGLPVNAYAEVNGAILECAQTLARDQGTVPVVILVWDGDRGDGDTTADFGDRAEAMGFDRLEISTLTSPQSGP